MTNSTNSIPTNSKAIEIQRSDILILVTPVKKITGNKLSVYSLGQRSRTDRSKGDRSLICPYLRLIVKI